MNVHKVFHQSMRRVRSDAQAGGELASGGAGSRSRGRAAPGLKTDDNGRDAGAPAKRAGAAPTRRLGRKGHGNN